MTPWHSWNQPHCYFRSPLWHLSALSTFRGGERTRCLRYPASNVMTFGKQQIYGDSGERTAHSLPMVVSERRDASGCVSEYTVAGLQSPLLIVLEQGGL